MVAHIGIYDDADNPAGTLAVSLSGGQTQSTTFHIWNDKDYNYNDTTDATNLRLVILAYDGAKFVGYGMPLLDEHWTSATVTGDLDPDANGMPHQVTGTLPLGAAAAILLEDIPQNCARIISFRIAAPGNVPATFTRLKLQVYGGDPSVALASLVILATGSGVIPGDRIASLRSLLRGSTITADNSDTIIIDRGAQTFDGTMVNFPRTSHTFNRNDSAAVAIGAGEQYLVTVSRQASGALTFTKGPKAEIVAYPATPANEIFVATLIVTSADGATAHVAQASVNASLALYAQYLVRAGAGLSVIVSPGEGVTDTDQHQRSSTDSSVNVVAASTNRIWRLGLGSLAVTQSDVRPEPGADLLALATTDGGSVTSIVDARRFAHRPITELHLEMKLRAALSQAAVPLLAVDLGVLHFDAELESVDLELTATDGTWTAGVIKIDVRAFAPGAAVPFPAGGAGAGGATIFTSFATDDRRPSIAWNAAVLRAVSIDHEVRRFVAGTRFVLDLVTTVAAPGAEPQQEIRVTLHLRRYR